MDAIEAILTRRSIRKFVDKEVTDDMVNQMIECAMSAPSAKNQQPWHFIVVRNKDMLNKVTEINPYAGMAKNADVGILVCGDLNLEVATKGFWVQDCSAAIENLLLSARALGLGAVWTGIYPKEELVEKYKENFNLPDNIIPLAFVPIGHPAQESKKADRLSQERIHKDSW